MKFASSRFSFVVASAAVFLAGCTKKPIRPDPQATVLGPTMGVGGPISMAPTDVPVNPDAPGLMPRSSDFDAAGHNRTALQAHVVYFDFDRSDIRPSERVKLQAAKDYLAENPTHRLLLEGHCDWRGTAEYNLGLGERRAGAAKRYLQSIGVAADRVETLSKGSLDASKNADAATMEKDRRVDLIVVAPRSGPVPL